MKNKIQVVYPKSVFITTSAETVYVADFTERTGSARKVEVHTSIPNAPGNKSSMECLKLNNKQPVDLVFNVFGEHQFKDKEGKDVSHCECCFFPSLSFGHTFIAFVEIKDCKPGKISDYKEKVKEQIQSTLKLFKSSSIVEKEKVYGIISFPRRNKVAFNEYFYRDNYELTKWVKSYGIHLIASNEIDVVSDKEIRPVSLSAL